LKNEPTKKWDVMKQYLINWCKVQTFFTTCRKNDTKTHFLTTWDSFLYSGSDTIIISKFI